RLDHWSRPPLLACRCCRDSGSDFGGLDCFLRLDFLAGGGLAGGALHHRLAEPLTQHSDLLELRGLEIGVTIGEVLHRVVHPLLLVFRCGLEDTAAEDVAEQLVPRLIEGRWEVRGRAGRLLLRQWTFLVAWGGASRPARTRFDPAIYRIRSPSGKAGIDCAPSNALWRADRPARDPT